MSDRRELTYRRVHQASPELLFDCMTVPEHLAHFWGPTGSSTPVHRITVDLRPGGEFVTVMVNDSDGSEYTMRAVYEEVVRPHRLAWREPASGMTTTISFEDLGDGTTEVVTHQTNVPVAYLAPEAREGFATSLDRFDAYVAEVVSTDTRRQHAVAAEYIRLADALEPLAHRQWDAPSLCDGWRIREVVAHLTMPARYDADAFLAELRASGGDFTVLSNRIATRDGAAEPASLMADLRNERLHHWTPPGGGWIGALDHVVIHGLDITIPLGLATAPPDAVMTTVLDDLVGGTAMHFGVTVDGHRFEATDIDWASGDGVAVAGTAAELVILLAGRRATLTAPIASHPAHIVDSATKTRG